MTEHDSHASAGAGSPAPAVASAHPGEVRADAGRPASVDVVAPAARTELDRIRRRWAELSLAQAERRMPVLSQLLADLASRSTPRLIAPQPPADPVSGRRQVAGAQEVGVVEVPDLGPAVVVDQLTVLVWDAYAQGNGDGIPQLLTTLRRDLS